MKTLKIILYALYLMLIILLLLSNIKGCNNNNRTEYSEPITESTDTLIVRQAERTGNIGELKVTLLWNFQGDIDLHVAQPNGKEIFFDNRRDRSTGGYLDVDNRDGGRGSAENIYWERAEPGEYQVSVEYYGPSKTTYVAESGVCSVVIFQTGKEPQTYKVDMTAVKDKKVITTIIVTR